MKITTLCYIEKDEQYLMLYRNKKENDPNEGKWIGIGGKLENNESVEECLLREVKEEIGVTLTDYTYRGIVHFISDTWENEEMHLYTASEYEGSLFEECNEGTLRWIPKKDVFALPLWEGDKLFLKELIQNKAPIHLTLHYEGETLVSHSLQRNVRF